MSRRTIRRAMLLLGSALGALAIFSPAAFASGAPIVTNEAPQINTLTTATLQGTINPNGGGSTTYKVEYGKTKLYGKSTPTFTISGAESVPFYAAMPVLEEMSTYHFRITATNSLGTTVTSDAMFETLLSWKVEGARVYELFSPVGFEDTYKGKASEGGHVEFQGFILGKSTRIYCEQSTPVHGTLGVEYAELNFAKGCFTQIEGVVNANCQPVGGITLHLTGSFAQASTTTVTTSPVCVVGEKLTFSRGGYGPEPLTESAELIPDLWGTTYFGGTKPFDSVISINGNKSPGAWKLTGTNAGKKFGIS